MYDTYEYFWFLTHLKDKGGDRGVVFGANKGKGLGKMALPGTHEKQTRAGKEKAVQTPKSGECHAGRHGVHHHTKGTTGERLEDKWDTVDLYRWIIVCHVVYGKWIKDKDERHNGKVN